MREEERARKFLDAISGVVAKAIEQRMGNVVQTALAQIASITVGPDEEKIHTVRLLSYDLEEFECPKMCMNNLSVGEYVWLHYIGDLTNAYIAVPVIPSPVVTPGGGSDYELPVATTTSLGGVIVGENLIINNAGVISVDTVSTVEEDNTKPITSSAVYTEVGNINVILETI